MKLSEYLKQNGMTSKDYFDMQKRKASGKTTLTDYRRNQVSSLKNKIGLDTFESDLKTVGTTVDDIYKGWQPKETMENTRSTVESMKERISAFQEYQKLIGGDDAIDISDLENSYNTVLKDWDSLAETYGQYKDADSFKIANKSIEEHESDIKTLDEQIADLKAKKEKLGNEYMASFGDDPFASSLKFKTPELGDVDSHKAWKSQSFDYDKQISELENKKAEEQKFYNDKKALKEQDEMANSKYAIDGFEKYLADEEAAKKTAEEKEQNKKWYEVLGGYLSNTQDTTIPGSAEINAVYDAYASDDSYKKPTDEWDEKQKRIFGAYYNPDSPHYDIEKAYEYAKEVNDEIAEKKANEEKGVVVGSATSNGLAGAAHTAGAILTAPFGLVDYVDNLIEKSARGTITKKQSLTPFDYSQAVTEGISTDLNEKHGTLSEDIPIIGGKGWGDVYGLGTSVAQSAASAYALGGVGTLVSYFGQGAAAGVDDALSRGASEEQAIIYGTILGAAEGASEMIGAEKLLGLGSANEIQQILLKGFRKGGAKEFFKLLNKQGLSEAIEEGISSFAGQVADNFVLQDKSNFNAMVKEYMANGMSKSEATQKAWMESIEGIAYDTLGGYISGGVHAGPQIGVAAIKTNAENKTQGKTIRGNERVGDLLEIASMTPQESDAYKAYTEYAKRGINAENITDAQLGNLRGITEVGALETLASKDGLFKKGATVEQKKSAVETLHKLNKVDTDNVAAKKAKELTKDLKTGENTEIAETGKSATIKGIKIESNEVITSEGETLSENDVTFSERDKELLGYAKQMDETTANLFLEIDDGQAEVTQYKDSFDLAMDYAKHDFTQDTILENKGVLSTSQVSAIYKATVINTYKAKQAAIDNLNAKHGNAFTIQGKVDDSVIDYDNTGAEGKVAWNSLNTSQRKAITFMKGLARATGMNLELISDGLERGINGAYKISENTIVLDIYAGMDKVEGTDFSDTIIPTASHEMTHWMKDKAPELYRAIDELVFKTLKKSGLTEQEILDKRMLKMKENHPDKDYSTKEGREEVRDEVIARACEDMLAMSEEGKKLFNSLSETEQKTFVEKIQEIIQNLKEWVYDLLSHYKSNSPEAREMRKYQESLNELSKLWDEMLRQSIQANQSLQKEGIIAEELVNGISKDGTTIVGKNNLQMSERTYAEGGRDFLSNWLDGQEGLSKEDKQDILNQTDAIAKLMKDIRENNDLPDYARWAAMDVVKDENGEKVLSVIVKNGDYAMNIDFSQVCKKRVALNAVLNAMVQSGDLNTYTLTETDVAELNAIIKEHEFEIACALCFVDSKRYRVGSWAESFCEGAEKKKNGKMVHQYGFNEMVRSLIPKGSNIQVDEFNFTNRDIVGQPTSNLLSEMDDSKLDFTLIDKILKQEHKPNGKNTDLYAYAKAIKDNKELRKILNPAEIISSIGLDAIRLEKPKLYGLINRHQGTAKPKFAHDVVAYTNDILKANNFTKEKARMVGGVRCQSFSDFMANMVFDYVQFISELSAKELTAHSYTKEPLFVKLFGLTGMKINMSLVPKAVQMTPEQQEYFAILNDKNANKRSTEYQKALKDYNKLSENAGLDENGNYIWEDETFPYDIAMEIVVDPRYSANCGTIAVGISDKHILKLLNDDNISMVIPYHKSGLNHIVAMMRNIDLYVDYTTTQNTRFANGKKLEKVPDFNFYGDLYGVDGKEGTHDPKKTADNYLKWCDEHNYIPKFEKSITGRKFRDNPNYYKLLIDFRVYDIDGTYREQQAVKPIYPENEEFKDLILNGVVDKDGKVYGGLKQQQATSDKLSAEAQQIIDEYRERLKEKHGKDVLGTQYSDRDSDDYAPTFYSHMGKTINEIKQDKIGSSSVVPYLKGKGVKNDEIKWSGIETFLEGKKSVTKEELQEFVLGSQLNIEEQIIDGVNRETEWDDYTLDGGENYREIVFSMPNSNYSNTAMQSHWGYDAKGVVAHARIQDFRVDGEKMLFIEEIQSDWHNAGKKYGYEGEDTLASDSAKDYQTMETMLRLLRSEGFLNGDDTSIAEEVAALNVYARAVRTMDLFIERTNYGGDPEEPLVFVLWDDGDAVIVEEDAEDFKVALDNELSHIRGNELSEYANAEIAPDAPFRDNYHEYVLKRLIRMAAEEGYDSIGWTTADIQSERWSNQFAEGYRIEYDQDIPKFLRKYGKKWGTTVSKTTLDNHSDIVTYVDNNGKVYDNIVSWYESVMDSYAEKDQSIWNDYIMDKVKVIQVGNTMNIQSLRTGEILEENLKVIEGSDTVWYMDITNSMKESVLYEGQVMYSDRDNVSSYETMGELERLRRENEKFKADVERLKERLALERQVTGGTTFNRNQLDAVAAHIRNLANSDYSKPDLVKLLDDVYTYIITAKELTWDDLYSKLYDISKTVLEESRLKKVETNDYYKQVLKEIRNKKISLSDVQKQELESAYGISWNKAVFGKLKVSDDATMDLDSQWSEWANVYPGLFDAETTEGDQIIKLLELHDDLRDGSAMYEDLNNEDMTRWLANEIYNQYWNVSTIKTTADKYDKQIKMLNWEHRKAMKELRDNHQERLAKQKQADKDKYNEIIKKIRQRKEEEIQEVRKLGKERLTRYKEEAARKTRIQSITSNALTLNEWLIKNSKDKHIHESLKGPVVTLLQAIDFSSKQLLGMKGSSNKGTPTRKDISLQKALGKVQKMMADANVGMEELVELYGHDLDASIESMIKSVDAIAETMGDNEFVLNQMTLEDLITLDNVVKTIKHAVTKMNKFHIVHHAKGISNLAQETIIDVDKLGKAKIFNSEKMKGKVQKLLNWRNTVPYYAFKRFGDSGKKIFEAFQDGWDKLAFNVKEIIDFTNDTYKAKEVQDWEKELHTFKLRMPATEDEMASPGFEPQYQDVQMTTAQIMHLYLLNMRDAAKLHLLGGGIRVADIEAKKGEVISQGDGVIFEQDEIDSIISTLTPRQKEVANELSRFMNTTSSDWGNEVSMARFGYRAFTENNYVPIQADKNNLAVDDETEKGNSLFKLLNMSFTKSLVDNANNRIVISSLFDVFAQHTSDMAKYNALALPVLDAFRWFNYKEKGQKGDLAFITKSVKTSIEKAFGKDGQSYITTFLKDINGQENVTRDTIGGGFFKNAKIASVGANIRVALLQPTAYLKAGANIDTKYLTKALFHKPKISYAEKYCGMALWKSMGYFDTNVQRGVAEQIKHAETFTDKAVEWSMKGAELGDKLTFGYLWNASELEVREKRKDLKPGSDEFFHEVGKRLRDILYSTQVVDSTLTRSEMMRSGDGRDKMLTVFASEPTLAYNMLQDVYMETSLEARRLKQAGEKHSGRKAFAKHGKRMARVMVAYTMTNIVAAMIESGFDVLRDDDDEEMNLAEFMKIYLQNFADNQMILTKIPYAKELVSIMQGFTSSRTDTQWMSSFSNTLKQVMKLVEGDGNPVKLIKNTLQTFSYFFGLPFYNAYRDIMATLNKLDILTTEELEELLSEFMD